MRDLSALAAAAALLVAVAAPAETQELELKIGTEGAYPPFNNVAADGQVVGFDVDIAKALCEEMKARCEFVVQEWSGLIPALQAGKFDAIVASMSITAERKEQVDFTQKYYQTPPAIIVGKDSAIVDTSPAALAGKALGVQGQTTHANYAEAAYGQSEIKLYPASDEAQFDLVNGRIDAIMDERIALEAFLETTEGMQCCKMLGAIEPVPEFHGEGTGIAVRKGDTALLDRLNAAITAIRANGKYKLINDMYFKYDIYGK